MKAKITQEAVLMATSKDRDQSGCWEINLTSWNTAKHRCPQDHTKQAQGSETWSAGGSGANPEKQNHYS